MNIDADVSQIASIEADQYEFYEIWLPITYGINSEPI